MGERCFHCKKRNADPAGCGEHTFPYNGLELTIIRTGGSCNQCTEEMVIKQIEKLPADLITPVQGQLPTIDWKVYVELEENDRGDEYHGGLFDQTTQVFLHLGILVFPEHNDCWILTGCGMNLGPLLPLFGGLGFVREEDARAFAKYKYSRAKYGVFISKQSSSELIK